MSSIKTLVAACAAALMLSACNSDTGNSYNVSVTEDFSSFGPEMFEDNGQWTEAYNSGYTTIAVSPYYFSHYANNEGGVKSFYGFSPAWSISANTLEGVDWQDAQWACMAPNINSLSSNPNYPYMLGFCDVRESADKLPQNPMCCIIFEAQAIVKELAIANSAYGYWAMINGSNFSQPFDEDSWCKVNITGFRNGKIVGTVSSYLAKDGEVSRNWDKVDLSSLGLINGLYFTMESSDKGTVGMNNPAFFCLGRIIATFVAE